MDSVTQLALGAAVGQATAGRQVGRRAILWGAICGTLPDLDVFVSLGDAVRDFTYHRSASHSILVMLVVSPLVAWLITKFHPNTKEHHMRWLLLAFLALATHPLLDCFTVYGTQILWPLPALPVTWSTLFIIDPAYTLPLLVGVIAALLLKDRDRASRVNWLGIVLSCTYLAWTVGAKVHINQVAQDNLEQQGIKATASITTPGPFNTLLWRIIAVDETNQYEGLYSVFDQGRPIQFHVRPRQLHLIAPISEDWNVQRLRWFTKELFSVSSVDDDVIMNDLRMGYPPNYVFRFKVGEKFGDGKTTATKVERISAVRDLTLLPLVWERIWNPDAL